MKQNELMQLVKNRRDAFNDWNGSREILSLRSPDPIVRRELGERDENYRGSMLQYRLLRPDRLDDGTPVTDPAHQDLRRRVCLALQMKFDGATFYEAGKAYGFKKREMVGFWKLNRWKSRPILFNVLNT